MLVSASSKISVFIMVKDKLESVCIMGKGLDGIESENIL